jgi:hypothetical protein
MMSLSEHFMMDLETFGNGSNAMIVSIGACDFNMERKFYAVVDPERSSGDISPGTVKWWMQQSDDARAMFKAQGEPLEQVLAKFTRFLNDSAVVMDKRKVWGNGATFDNVILSNAYDRHNMARPWMFWNDRCYRTLKGLYPGEELPKREGTHHNALDDALYQTLCARKMLGAVA